ncbi:MAG: hypothetical protein J7641_04660 [Cyanobacteria bacterium SID2]|nr:hypothetical protein [Cyanobacteria bacterium SID2]MBP0004339.1 hypothetical protein [Cyanobacteria bacterium SBC]
MSNSIYTLLILACSATLGMGLVMGSIRPARGESDASVPVFKCGCYDTSGCNCVFVPKPSNTL